MATVEDARKRMDDALDAVRREFATVRTGKASPALLDTVRVDAYGSKMPLNQVATVSTPDPTLLVVQPFDKTLIGEIERGIQSADLGLNPANDGNVIRVPVPPLNEERRKEYAKLLHKMAEEGRISIRHARRIVRDDIQSLARTRVTVAGKPSRSSRTSTTTRSMSSSRGRKRRSWRSDGRH
jgi:ribosome recycling factor